MSNIEVLKGLLQANPDWQGYLGDSLREAKRIAVEKKVRDAEKMPDTIPLYYKYLKDFMHWIPREDYDKEVLHKLCTYYWLLDQPPGRALQEKKAFREWMVDFANDWGSFLNTTDSITPETLATFEKIPEYHLDQYMPNPSGWLTFNQFFAREIKPGLRPVAGMFDDRIITSPADSTFMKKFPIDDDSEVTIKLTHKYKIEKLLEGSPYKNKFQDGIFMHSFLGPYDYHRFHAPVSGTVLECRAIQEAVYLDVVIKNGEFDAPDGAGYEFNQTRGLIIFESSIGLVAVLPIGMAQVSSVNMVAVEGAYLNKGDEFGYFMFGGSDIILLFQAESNVVVTAAPTIHYNTGMCIAEARGCCC